METRVVRFSAVERLVHALYLLAFLTLAATGLVLFLPQLGGLTVGEAGQLNRLVHRLAAVALMAAPVVYLLFDWPNARASLRRVLTWGPADRQWFRAAPRYYWTGDRTGIPPQGKFNTGQKLHALVQLSAFTVFVATGLVMWLWAAGAPPLLFRTSVILHDLAFVASAGFFLLHLYLSTIHPLTRQHIGAIVDGTIPEADARALYPLWHEELQGRARERAR